MRFLSTHEIKRRRISRRFIESRLARRQRIGRTEENTMRNTTLILIAAVASLLCLGVILITSRSVRPGKASEPAPQKITVMYGDVPVSLAADAFQMPFDRLF
jgi:hypothetical protein